MSIVAQITGQAPHTRIVSAAPLARLSLSNPAANLTPILPSSLVSSAAGGGSVQSQAALVLVAPNVEGIGTYLAGTPLSSHRVVFQDDSDNRVRYVDPEADSIAEVLGVTTTATGAAGEIVYVQAAGVLADPSFSFLPGPVFVGANGVLTQNPPTAGAILQVGVATTLTTLLIRIQQPIYLGD